jgi:hypothetical protein
MMPCQHSCRRLLRHEAIASLFPLADYYFRHAATLRAIISPILPLMMLIAFRYAAAMPGHYSGDDCGQPLMPALTLLPPLSPPKKRCRFFTAMPLPAFLQPFQPP